MAMSHVMNQCHVWFALGKKKKEDKKKAKKDKKKKKAADPGSSDDDDSDAIPSPLALYYN